MKIYTALPTNLPPTALTIGFFDGVHLGHQHLLHSLKSLSPHTTILTFISPPSQLFHQTPLDLLTTLTHKLSLLEQHQPDVLIVIPFTSEFASISFEELLSRFPLTHLVLGQGAAFGHKKLGTESAVQSFATSFTPVYLPKFHLNNEPVSSTRIRSLIRSNQLALAKTLLGRPHSLYFPPNTTQTTAPTLCLPPNGTYSMNHNISLTITDKTLSIPHPLPTQTLLQFDNPPESDHV